MKFNCLNLFKTLLIVIFMNFVSVSKSQVNEHDALMFGAEIFIEPGQTDDLIEAWFKTLSENNMHLTRIRMFENYMKDENDDWDFSLFDKAFKYAEKYNVKVYANLFPATDFTNIGGFKFPYDGNHLDNIAAYIKVVVSHFKNYPSLYGWVPINEPGGGSIHDPLAMEIFAKWKEYQAINKKGGLEDIRHFSFEDDGFLLYYNTWYLKWLTEEIRKYDSVKPVHVNTHQIFDNVAQYDFPAWSRFLTSLGGSAHASWHFGYFPRNKYHFAMSANSEIILSGAQNIPWLMTELQGGNNIYSGYEPFCPTKEEIAQWLWITVGTGAKGAIFWCLNPRMSGIEAGEWAMIDFQNKPTDRLTEAGKVAKVISENETLFRLAKPVNSKINILYNRESLWVEHRMRPDFDKNNYEIRNTGSVMKSAISYFEALSQKGFQPTFKEFNEFDFKQNDYSGQTIILANQIAISEKYYDDLRHFVKNGGTLIVDGLTAFYDENAVSKMVNRFPLSDLFGGEVSEFIFEKDIFSLEIDKEKRISAHAIKGVFNNSTERQKQSYVRENEYGKGKVLWIPSLIGLGARKTNSYEDLLSILDKYIDTRQELGFDAYYEGLLMKNVRSGDKLISILINKNENSKSVRLKGFTNYHHPKILYSNKKSSMNGKIVNIDSEDTLVILWDKKES